MGIVADAEFFEGESLSTYAAPRAGNAEQSLIVKADVQSWDLAVYDVTSGSGVPLHTALGQSPDLVMFDTPQNPWGEDGIGYTFQHTIQGGAFETTGERTYRLEYRLRCTAASGYGDVIFASEPRCLSVLSLPGVFAA